TTWRAKCTATPCRGCRKPRLRLHGRASRYWRWQAGRRELSRSTKFLYRQPRRFLLRLFLARSDRLGDRLALHDHFHMKLFVVIGADRAGEAVLRQPLVA